MVPIRRLSARRLRVLLRLARLASILKTRTRRRGNCSKHLTLRLGLRLPRRRGYGSTPGPTSSF